MFLCFFIFKMFFVLFNVMFLLLLKTKTTYKITNMMHFSWTNLAKTPFPGQSERFVALLLTLFDSY